MQRHATIGAWLIALALTSPATAQAQSVAGVDLAGVSFSLTETAAPSWSSSMIAWWSLDEDTTATRDQDGGSCGSGCNLAASGSIPNSTSEFVEGAASIDFSLTETDTISCSDANCSALERAGSGDHSLTWGCWFYDDLMSNSFPIIKTSSATDGYFAKLTGSVVQCQVNTTQDSSAAYTTMAWQHFACRFDDSANEVEAFVNGGGSGSPSSVSAMTENAVAFYVGGDGGSNDFAGFLDECFVYAAAMAATSICRICSCGITGSLCKYAGSVWTDIGRNVSHCGSCALPATPSQSAPS